MFESIKDDIKFQLRQGNMITRLIIINIAVFVLVNLIHLFFMGDQVVYYNFLHYIALNGELINNVTRPWVIITHMFLHLDILHILFNMLFLYWFGRIVGDFIGDRKIWPLYLLGGLAGVVGFSIFAALGGASSIALGASGAVMAFVVAAASISPDYIMRLLIIGDVKLKYVALGYILIDLAMAWKAPGSAAAHLAGAMMGWIFVSALQSGTDLSKGVNRISDAIVAPFSAQPRPKPRKKLVVVHQAKDQNKAGQQVNQAKKDNQEDIDAILDKINEKGYESLTDEEKDILYRASQQ